MLDFVRENLGTIIVGAVLAVGVIAIAVKMVKDKKNNKGGCGCGCAMKDSCHK